MFSNQNQLWDYDVFYILSMLWVLWGWFSVDQFRLSPEARGCECDVMMIFSRSFQTNQGNVIVCSMMDVFTVCYCFLISLCEAEVYVFEIPNLTIFESQSVIFDNHFWVSISYTWIAFRSLERTEVFVMFLMMSCFDLTILESSISSVIYYWDTFWLLIREPLDFVIYHWCLQLLIENCRDHMIIIWCLSVAHEELM